MSPALNSARAPTVSFTYDAESNVTLLEYPSGFIGKTFVGAASIPLGGIPAAVL